MRWCSLCGVFAVLSLPGCVSNDERAPVAVAAPAPVVASGGLGWARADGQRISGNAELISKARADIARCDAESPPRVPTGARGESCMRMQGYYVRGLD
jgi:hypothetical protein